MAGVVLSPTSVSVTPGGEAVCTVNIRNSSAVVDSFVVTVLGEAAGWTTVTPATVSLFPGADGTAEIHFRPPRNASLRAGAVDFAVRVASTQSDDSVVEEGVVSVDAFTEIAARITPRTSEGKRKAKHVVAIDNKGNAPVTVSVAASDPDEALAFQPTPPEVTIEPGEAGAISIGVAARSGFARGPAQHRPFQAVVTPSPAGMQLPITLDANFVQKAGMPAFVPALVAAAVILIAAVIVVPGLTKKDDDGGKFSLTGATGTSTTVAAAAAGGEGGEEGGEGEADAEVAEGSGGETAAGESGGGGQQSGGGDSPATTIASSGGGGGKAVVTTTTPTDDDSPATTAPDAAPVTSTTIPPTTTAPPPHAKWVGTWKNPVATGNQAQMDIRVSGNTMFVRGWGFCSPSFCDWGETSTTITDAADNSITIKYTFSFKTTSQTVTFVSPTQIRTNSTDNYSDGRVRTYSDTFNKA